MIIHTPALLTKLICISVSMSGEFFGLGCFVWAISNLKADHLS